MLSRGPIEGREYFEYDERLDYYIPTGEIEDFEKSYVRLTPDEIAKGMERDVIYYTKVIIPGQSVDLQDPFNDDEPIFDHSTVISPGSPIRFERVPSSFTEFEEGVTYYKLVFNKDYYMLKK
jgi:hypothetical protein